MLLAFLFFMTILEVASLMDEFYLKGKVLIGSEAMRSTLARFHRVFIDNMK